MPKEGKYFAYSIVSHLPNPRLFFLPALSTIIDRYTTNSISSKKKSRIVTRGVNFVHCFLFSVILEPDFLKETKFS